MPQRTKRTFRPIRKYIGNTMMPTKIEYYKWTKGGGLWVHYFDGLKLRADYNLSELLRGNEVREVFDDEESF